MFYYTYIMNDKIKTLLNKNFDFIVGVDIKSHDTIRIITLRIDNSKLGLYFNLKPIYKKNNSILYYIPRNSLIGLLKKYESKLSIIFKTENMIRHIINLDNNTDYNLTVVEYKLL